MVILYNAGFILSLNFRTSIMRSSTFNHFQLSRVFQDSSASLKGERSGNYSQGLLVAATGRHC